MPPRRVGDISVTYEVLALVADPGMSLVVYSAAAGTADADALRFLASWDATARRPRSRAESP